MLSQPGHSAVRFLSHLARFKFSIQLKVWFAWFFFAMLHKLRYKEGSRSSWMNGPQLPTASAVAPSNSFSSIDVCANSLVKYLIPLYCLWFVSLPTFDDEDKVKDKINDGRRGSWVPHPFQQLRNLLRWSLALREQVALYTTRKVTMPVSKPFLIPFQV